MGYDVTPLPEELEKKRVWRKWLMRFLTMVFCIFCLLEFVGGFVGYYQVRFGQKILKEGIALEASIEQHYIKNRKFKSTKHFLEYKFSNGNQEYKRTIILPKSTWDQLEGKKTVSIRVLPDLPEKSRVEVGDAETTSERVLMLVGFLGGSFFLFMFTFTFLGYDIVLRNGVLYLLKHGQIIEDRIAELAEKEKNKNRSN